MTKASRESVYESLVTCSASVQFMKADPELPEKFATALIEQIALLRAEVIAQRSLLIELLSLTSHERRRKIKDRLYDKRMSVAFRIAPSLRKHIGLKKRGWLSQGFLDDEHE